MSVIRSLASLVLFAALAASAAPPAPAAPPRGDSCLMAAASCISNPGANFYLYYTFSRQGAELRRGDALEYDVYLCKSNPLPVGGIDIDTERGDLRDSHSVDAAGLSAHGDTALPAAVGHWLHRRIPLDKLAGQKTVRFNVVFEADPRGTYVQFLDHVRITRGQGDPVVIYDGGEPIADPAVAMKEGYSQAVLFKAVPRSAIVDGADLAPLVDRELKGLKVRMQLDDLRAELELARKVADRAHDQHLSGHVAESTALVEKAEKDNALDAEGLQTLIHQVHASLNHQHPAMRAYTGHLVGHAHIDFQWLWEWPETVQVCHDTFNQALKFMDEFPGFKFSQSSSALYSATEQAWPEVFKGIQEQVAKGNWEIVGGRVCEGDENMISPESHARHFLYGQRYFRERFAGKQAVVGWEPDTFGHTLQFPQILTLGGCKYFYFCRGGYNHPMFWWQAPDGTRVLAFEEPATGGWYNGDVTNARFDRLFNFADATGSKDMLWVYGVGNHGGGPTRENINAALSFQKVPFLPNVKFSTATEFFHALEKYDLTKLPVHTTDMNTTANAGFYGVFTTHSDIKRWNRDAEAMTESAEAVAAFASRLGFAYPGEEFRRNWTDICWNHHHDTLPGTSIHPSYNKSEKMYARVIESSRKIAGEALGFIGSKVRTDEDGILVFNPTSAPASAVVTVDKAGELLSAGRELVQTQATASGQRAFFAADIPPFGYRVFKPASAVVDFPIGPSVSKDLSTLENLDYRVVLDNSRGVVTSVYDKKNHRESIAKGGSGNRLEIHWEKPNGMSAWTIGEIDHVEPVVSAVTPKVLESGPARVTIGWDRVLHSTTLHQTVSLAAHGAPEFSMATEWKELGSGEGLSPFLKVAFDLAVDAKPVFTLQTPFATITKPLDGVERPALKFADLAGSSGGAGVLNDCKHGYSAEAMKSGGATLRLSLIRSSHNPDPRPNDRPQAARWVLLPHAGSWQAGQVLQAAEAFNHPMLTAGVKANPSGTLPGEGSFLSVSAPDVVITGVKQAEDDGDLVVRCYEAYGRPATARLAMPFATGRVQVVNFVEDRLGGLPEAAVGLRGWQIVTLKMATGGEAKWGK